MEDFTYLDIQWIDIERAKNGAAFSCFEGFLFSRVRIKAAWQTTRIVFAESFVYRESKCKAQLKYGTAESEKVGECNVKLLLREWQ